MPLEQMRNYGTVSSIALKGTERIPNYNSLHFLKVYGSCSL